VTKAITHRLTEFPLSVGAAGVGDALGAFRDTLAGMVASADDWESP